jgi:group I intron endonuclease
VRTGVIYALSADGQTYRYVGLTVQPRVRLNAHRHAARHGQQYPVYNWMRKHGPENVRMRVLCYASVDDLPAAEQWWITELRSLGYDLLNLTDGGEGNIGWTMPEDVRARLAAHVKSEEHRRRISEAMRGRTQSPEHVAKVVEARRGKPGPNTGKTFSHEWRANMRTAKVGKPRPRSVIDKMTGRKQSAETRAKQSAALRAYWASKRNARESSATL